MMTDTRDDTPEDDSPFRSPQVLETYLEESKKIKQIRTVAFYQKLLLISIGLQLLFLLNMYIPLSSLADYAPNGRTYLYWLSILYLAMALLGIISVFPIAYRIESLSTAIHCSMSIIVPFVGLFMLFIVNSFTNAYFRKHGLTTHWLGPDLRTLPKDGEDETVN